MLDILLSKWILFDNSLWFEELYATVFDPGAVVANWEEVDEAVSV